MKRILTRREFLRNGAICAGGLALAGLGLGSLEAAESQRPNFLFISTDQQWLGAIGCMGNKWVDTPGMDRIARNGVRFERSICSLPLCSPSRATWITGMMPHQHGVTNNNLGLKSGVKHMGHIFRDAGYDTFWSGKWHLPKGWPLTIKGFRVANYKQKQSYKSKALLPVKNWKGRPVQKVNLGYNIDTPIADGITSFLKTYAAGDRRKPFFAHASLLNPHDICYFTYNKKAFLKGKKPSNLPPPPVNPGFREIEKDVGYLQSKTWREPNMTPHDWRLYRYAYYSMVHSVDREIVRILDTLESTGLTGNTVVIFTSDHGDGLGQVVSGTDILPTLCDYAGIKPPAGVVGRSMRPLVEGRKTEWRSYTVAQLAMPGPRIKNKSVSSLPGRAVRSDKFVFLAYEGKERNEQLFDLETDPGQTRNLAFTPEGRAVLKDHRDMLIAWCKNTGDPFRKYAGYLR
jgi:arylsulfatase A-like enzyme